MIFLHNQILFIWKVDVLTYVEVCEITTHTIVTTTLYDVQKTTASILPFSPSLVLTLSLPLSPFLPLPLSL